MEDADKPNRPEVRQAFGHPEVEALRRQSSARSARRDEDVGTHELEAREGSDAIAPGPPTEATIPPSAEDVPRESVAARVIRRITEG
jgi:hypothetical protein